jgi:ribosomal protein S6E (S10)
VKILAGKVSSDSTVVELFTRVPKFEGLNPAENGTRRRKNVKILGGKVSTDSTVVALFTHVPKFESLNPAASGTRRK